MALIQLEHIRKVYGHGDSETVALDDISLTIEPGEFVAIVGPSGCGKSTLMHIMGLLDEPTEGAYLLEGKDVASLSDKARAGVRLHKAGFVFQMFNLLPRITALGNVVLPMVYAERSAVRREKQGRELLGRVGMTNRVDHLPSELSGGQMQRVAIARALANKPEILFADEPTGNLDSKSGAQILELLTKLHKEGTTLVLVTHEASIAAAAQRRITMLDGRIVDDTKPKVRKTAKTSTKPRKAKKAKAKRPSRKKK